MVNDDYRSGEPFIMKGEGVPVESLNLFILTGGLFRGRGTVEVPSHFQDSVWGVLEAPQKARFCRFTLDNNTGVNGGDSLSFDTGQGVVIKAEIFLQMLDMVEELEFTGTGLAGLNVNVLKHYPSGGPEDVIIEDLNLSNPIVNILSSQLVDDSFYLELVATADDVVVESISLTVKTLKFSEGENLEIGTDSVPNESTVTGSNASDALDELKSQITALTAAIENQKFKVGYILHTSDSANPATYLGYGTWERYAQGRVLVSEGNGFAAGATGGNKEITLSVNQLPSHKHNVSIPSSGGDNTGIKTGLATATDGEATSGSGGAGTTAGSGTLETNGVAPTTNSTGSHNHALKVSANRAGAGILTQVYQGGADGWNDACMNAGSHTHTVNAHSHLIASHTHPLPNHSHTTPAHSHSIPDHSHSTPNHTHTVNEDNIGSAAPVNIMPPYQVVYVWRRTA